MQFALLKVVKAPKKFFYISEITVIKTLFIVFMSIWSFIYQYRIKNLSLLMGLARKWISDKKYRAKIPH